MSTQAQRYVAFDVHKSYVMVAAVNAAQQVVLPPRRVPFSRFEAWISKHLKPTDQVVLEATTNAWYVHDLLTPLVAQVVVAHPYRVKLTPALARRCQCCRRSGQDQQERHPGPGQATGRQPHPGSVGATHRGA